MIVTEFLNAMRLHGITTEDEIIADGKIHPMRVQGDKPGKKSGWYVLHKDGVPAGAFGYWKTGFKATWSLGRAMNDDQVEVSRDRRSGFSEEQFKEFQYAKAGEEAKERWASAVWANERHPYLQKKGVGCYGLKRMHDKLVVPLQDAEGEIQSLQFIDGVGNKRFLKGGKKKGCYYIIGDVGDTLCIAEGYATAASLYESTGRPVAVAFDCGNLMPVALALREKHPTITIIICADDDFKTSGNPGMTKACEAAAAVGGLVTFI